MWKEAPATKLTIPELSPNTYTALFFRRFQHSRYDVPSKIYHPGVEVHLHSPKYLHGMMFN
jgi:hypothetical protein